MRRATCSEEELGACPCPCPPFGDMAIQREKNFKPGLFLVLVVVRVRVRVRGGSGLRCHALHHQFQQSVHLQKVFGKLKLPYCNHWQLDETDHVAVSSALWPCATLKVSTYDTTTNYPEPGRVRDKPIAMLSYSPVAPSLKKLRRNVLPFATSEPRFPRDCHFLQSLHWTRCLVQGAA